MKKSVKKKEKHLFKNLFYWFAMLTGAIPGFIYFHPKYIYPTAQSKTKIKGGALVVSNHLSVYDPVYLMFALWYRRQRFVCMKELYAFSWARRFFNLARCIPIDRENPDFDSIREIIDALKNDEIVSIFPEGHINEDTDTIESFKSGAVLMSVIGGKPIIPIYIRRRPGFWGGITIVTGDAIDPLAIYGRRPSGEQMDEVADILRQKMSELKSISEENKK